MLLFFTHEIIYSQVPPPRYLIGCCGDIPAVFPDVTYKSPGESWGGWTVAAPVSAQYHTKRLKVKKYIYESMFVIQLIYI